MGLACMSFHTPAKCNLHKPFVVHLFEPTSLQIQGRDFTVRVIPPDSADLWAWALSAYTALCKTSLLFELFLKKLCIVLTDIVYSVVWTLLGYWILALSSTGHRCPEGLWKDARHGYSNPFTGSRV